MINKEDVAHIARLARITLTPDEADRYGGELSKILDFIATLEHVDTTGIEPLTGGTVLENAFREDAGGPDDPSISQELVASAPEHRKGYVVVKAVFDRS